MRAIDHYLCLLKDGHQQGLEYFMQRHLRALTYFARRMVKEVEVAEEIVQDCFVRVWESRNRFESAENVKAFLYIATRNACLNYLDAASTRRHARSEELSEDIQHPDSDVLTGMIHAETIALIHQELERLPEQQAVIFRLIYFNGLSTEEICESLGISANAVFLARSRATQTLKRVFKGRNLLYYIAFVQILVRG